MPVDPELISVLQRVHIAAVGISELVKMQEALKCRLDVLSKDLGDLKSKATELADKYKKV